MAGGFSDTNSSLVIIVHYSASSRPQFNSWDAYSCKWLNGNDCSTHHPHAEDSAYGLSLKEPSLLSLLKGTSDFSYLMEKASELIHSA